MKKILIRRLCWPCGRGSAGTATRPSKAMPQRQEQIATTKVRKGDVVVRSLRAGRTSRRSFGDSDRTEPVRDGSGYALASLGSLAQDKDLIVEFDDAEVQSRLEEKQLEIDQIDEQIKKSAGRSCHSQQSGPGRASEGAILGATSRTGSEAQ